MTMRLFRSNSHQANVQKTRPWAVTTIGRLLVLQGLGLLGLAWLKAPTNSNPQLSESWLALSFSLMGLFALLSSLSFLRLTASARNRAMILQGFCLTLALFLYFGERPVFTYPIMIYGIFLVLFLQHPDVRSSFPYEQTIEEGLRSS